MEFIHLDSIGSTNNYARNLLTNGKCKEGITVVTAENQFAGRGQKGNSWESEAGKNLTFSIICHPHCVKVSEQFILSQAIALSIVNTLLNIQENNNIEEADFLPFSVKWPNDIYYGNRKISGTLIECDLNGKSISDCIIGTGINVNQQIFKSDAPNPISLRQIYNHDFDRMNIMDKVMKRFGNYLTLIQDGHFEQVREEYVSLLYRKDGLHTYSDKNGTFVAEFVEIEHTGHLILRTDYGQIRRYEFKEIKFI